MNQFLSVNIQVVTSWNREICAAEQIFIWAFSLKIRQCLLAHLVTPSSLWFSGGLLMSWWKVISWCKTLSLCNNNFIGHLWEQGFMSSMAAWFYIFLLTKWHMLLETNTESSGTSSQNLTNHMVAPGHAGPYTSALLESQNDEPTSAVQC